MMNSKKILGENRPKGKARVIWNVLMIFATIIATSGSLWVLEGKTNVKKTIIGSLEISHFAWGGLTFLAILFVVGIVSFIRNEKRPA